MKKKVLLALIALVSFATSWAQTEVSVGDYTVTLSKGWIVAGEAVPTATVEKDGAAVEAKTIGVFDADGVAATGEAAGNYYLKIVVDGDQLLVPFKVGAVNDGNYDFVYNASTWEAATAQGRGLAKYYDAYEGKESPEYLDYGWWHEDNSLFTKMWTGENPQSEWGQNFSRSWITAINCIDVAWPERTANTDANQLKKYSNDDDASAYAALEEEGGMPSENWKKYGYPWVVFSFDDAQEDYNVVFRYNDEDKPLVDESLINYTLGKTKSWATVSGIFANGDTYPLWLSVNNKTGEVNNVPFPDFEGFSIDKFQVILLPAETLEASVVAAEDFDWSLTPASVPYSGEAQAPTITVGENELEATDYVAKYYDADGNEVEEMVEAGTYSVQLGLNVETEEGGESGTEFVPVGDSKEFTIAQTKIIITPSYVYKKYGQPDPEKPNFELASGQNMTDAQRAEILPFVFLKRLPGQEGEDKGMYEYFIDVVRDQSANNYEIAVTNNYSYLVVDPVVVTVSLTEPGQSKIYGEVDPDFKKSAVITVPEDIYQFVNVYPVPESEDEEGEKELTAEEQAIYDAELAAMEAIYNNLTIVRDEGEDVGSYNFDASLGNGTNTANFTLVKTELGQFEIKPYDITPVEDDPQTAEVDETDDKADFEITVADVTYNGQPQTPVPTVRFFHKALNKWIDLTDEPTDNPETADVDESVLADYIVGDYANNTNVKRKGDTRNYEKAATVEIIAGGDNLNPNFTGSKTANFAVKPAKLTIGFGTDYTKVYGEEDNPNILNPIFTGLIEGEEALANNIESEFWTSKPEYARVPGEDAGTYKIYAKSVGTTNNYDITSTEGKLTITKATLNVSASPYVWVEVDGVQVKSTDITYGDDVQFDVIVNGYINKDAGTTELEIYDENLLGEDGDEPEPEGTYGEVVSNDGNAGGFTYSFVGGDEELKNYYVVYEGGNGQVAPNADGLWITIEPKSKTYGTADPELTYVATLDGEEIDLADLYLEDEEVTDIVLARTPGSNAGKYDIEFLEGPGQIGNYTVNYDVQSGKKAFTIDKATLFVKATVVYPAIGEDEDGNPIYATSIAYGDDATGLFAIEEYKSHISQETGKAGSGLIDGDNYNTVINEVLAELGGKSVNELVEYTCDYNEDNLGVGKFTVSAEGPDAKNYVIVYNDGVNALNVVAAELTLKPKKQTFDYNVDGVDGKAYITPAINDEVSDATIAVIGAPLPGNVTIEDLVEAIECDETSVGTHAITITPKASDKVTVKYEEGEFEVKPLTEIHLSYDNVAQALEDNKGLDMEKAYLPARKLTAEAWYTFVLPFEFRVPELSNKLFYAIVDVQSEGNTNPETPSFVAEIGRVAANQPFLLKAAAEDEDEAVAKTAEELEGIFFENVTIAAEDADENEFIYNDLAASPFTEDAAGVKFIGQYTGKAKSTFTDKDKVLGKNAEGEFVWGNPATIKPTVAYLEFPTAEDAANARIYVEEADGTVTAIKSVSEEGEIALDGAAEGWYTIGGAKLNGKPATKGVYIHNGKKVSIQ